jgi:hypothetical protein
MSGAELAFIDTGINFLVGLVAAHEYARSRPVPMQDQLKL